MTGKDKKRLVNISVLLYFIFLILTNQLEHYVVFIAFYASLLLCGIVGLYTNGFHLSIKKIILILLLIITACLNLILVGNATIKHLIYICLFAFASLSFISKELEEKTLLIAFALNVIVIVYKLVIYGPYSDLLFTSSTRNFVSVYLMYPIVLYYSIIGGKNKEINMTPALIVWAICLWARGRGGIIVSTILVVGVLFAKYKKMRSINKTVISLVVVAIIALFMINIGPLMKKIESFEFMELFAKNQMGSSRLKFWPEYIELATTNTKNFLLGANISNTYFGRYLEGNPHNSFMELHMLNGFVGLLAIFLLLIKNGIQSIKNKNYLFLVCMLTMLLRAFTDHVLWAAFGTPILFYFIFYYTPERINRIDNT